MFKLVLTVLKQLSLGLWGIINCPYYSIQTKGLLLLDYLNIVLTGYWQRPVVIGALDLTINYASFPAFIFLFNEIFCRRVYPKTDGLKVFYDGGAHIGLTSLWYKLWNPHLKVVTFEPDPASSKLLELNLRSNGIKSFKNYTLALAAKKSQQIFYCLDDPIQNLDSGLRLNQQLSYHTLSVKTDQLSRYIKRPVSLLKLDIEGSEYSVIDDLIRSKKIQLIDQMVIEAHYFNAEDLQLMKKMVKNLKSKGSVEVVTTNRNSSMIYYRSMCIITQ